MSFNVRRIVTHPEDNERARAFLNAKLAQWAQVRQIADDNGDRLVFHRADQAIEVLLEVFVPLVGERPRPPHARSRKPPRTR